MLQGTRIQIIAFVAIFSALANILSLAFLTIPLVIGPFISSIHFTQLPIFLGGILAGPRAGFFIGLIGGLYMSYTAGIPFIIGGLGILGFMTGVFAHKFRLRPVLATGLSWCVQAPYVFLTDYFWFISTRIMPSDIAINVVITILVKLTVETVISALISDFLIHYLQRARILVQ